MASVNLPYAQFSAVPRSCGERLLGLAKDLLECYGLVAEHPRR